jgi:K(+)-stimulated pyrophosphate-energized sodium pump
MTNWVPWVALGVAGLSLAFAALLIRIVLKNDSGTEKMRKIARLIQDGAMNFLGHEYRAVAVFVVAVAILLAFTLTHGWMVAICYVFGALASLAAGMVGLAATTRTNSRTAEKARLDDMCGAFTIAFRGAAVMGFFVVGSALLGIAVCYLVFEVALGLFDSASIILGFALGASSVALFATVGGGIFTKGADVGADLAGKVEEGIPEDDPRNPAVIADNVGDNVGDVAGMGANLFESFVVATIAPIVIAAGGRVFVALGTKGMILPLAIGAGGILCTIVASLYVRTSCARPEQAIFVALALSAVLAAVVSFFIVWGVLGWKNVGIYWSLLLGMGAGIGAAMISEYYTSGLFRPVKRMAEASLTGAGTTVIRGMAEGMSSTIVSVILIAVAAGVAYLTASRVFPGGGIYGVSLVAIGMLSITAMVVSADAYGSVSDNAGGIAEMAGLPEEVRDRTDKLDAVGNTTAAITKGFAIGAAALATIALLAAYMQAAGLASINLINDKTLVGLLIGAMVPYAFSAFAMGAVERAAFAVVEEVRRQFREIPGLREGEPGVEPDYTRAVGMTAKTAINSMIVPSVLAFVLPLLIGVILGKETLAGFVAGALASGFLMGIWMINAGEGWDNAKKYIEAGNLGGKGTLVHAAAVVGDTVGDPLKDTAGPSMNILIKLMAVVALVFVPLFTRL